MCICERCICNDIWDVQETKSFQCQGNYISKNASHNTGLVPYELFVYSEPHITYYAFYIETSNYL